MNYHRKRLIDNMIERAVREAIAEYAIQHPTSGDYLRGIRQDLARDVADRITGDVGRERRMTQLFKQPKR